MFRNPSEGRVVKKAWSFRKNRTPLTSLVADSEGNSIDGARSPARQFRDEFQGAREAIALLQNAVDRAMSFREKANEVLEEAHRAINRLEQVTSHKDASELSIIACEIKCEVRRALTLLKVHGNHNFLIKLITLVARSSIYNKFDQVRLSLHNLILPSQFASPLAPRAPINGEVYAGTMLRNPQTERAHERVMALEYVLDNQIPGHFCIWWAVGQNLEFYSESTQSTTTCKMDKPQLQVTCIGLDPSGNLWTGHLKGLVRVRNKHNWGSVVEHKYFTDRVRCITFDTSGNAWLGDEAGSLRVIRYDVHSQQLELVTSISLNAALEKYVSTNFTQAGSHMPPSHASTSTMDDKAMLGAQRGAQRSATSTMALSWMNLFRGHSFTSCANPSAHSIHGPVRTMYARDNRVWVSGGRGHFAWLSVFDTITHTDVDMYECSKFGTAYVITEVPWGTALGTATSSVPTSPTAENEITLDLAVPSLPISTSSFRGDCGWRLLTGHENGQLVLWARSAQKLQPVLTIGAPGSACRGIFLFPGYNLMATVHYNGYMHLFTPPTAETETLSSGSLPQLKPRQHSFRAHRTAIIRMRGQGPTCVTASVSGTIRVWHGALLMEEAKRHGLITLPAERYLSGRFPSQSLEHTPSVSTNALVTLMSGRTDTLDADGMPVVVIDKNKRNQSQLSVNGGFQVIEESELQLTKTIGFGGYGKVWLADWSGAQVAVKQLNPPEHNTPFPREGDLDEDGSVAGGNAAATFQNAFDNEVSFMGSLSHPNVVRFLAVVMEPPMIVMQYYPHGSLFDLLKRARRSEREAIKELHWVKRLDMLRDMAAGMTFLHKRGVVHGDVRSPNMLLDYTSDKGRPRFHIRIADFGLARMLGRQGHVCVSKPTNPRWAAPEVIQASQLSKAADVFSFGVVMWEMLTWQEPYEDMMSLQVLYNASQNKRPELPANDEDLPGQPGPSIKTYKLLMEKCWAQEASARPGFDQIMANLDVMRSVESTTERPRHAHNRSIDGSSPENGAALSIAPTTHAAPTPDRSRDSSPMPPRDGSPMQHDHDGSPLSVPGGEINMITLTTSMSQQTRSPPSPPTPSSPFAGSPFADFMGFSTPTAQADSRAGMLQHSPFGSSAYNESVERPQHAQHPSPFGAMSSPFGAASHAPEHPRSQSGALGFPSFSPFSMSSEQQQQQQHSPAPSHTASPFASVITFPPTSDLPPLPSPAGSHSHSNNPFAAAAAHMADEHTMHHSSMGNSAAATPPSHTPPSHTPAQRTSHSGGHGTEPILLGSTSLSLPEALATSIFPQEDHTAPPHSPASFGSPLASDRGAAGPPPPYRTLAGSGYSSNQSSFNHSSVLGPGLQHWGANVYSEGHNSLPSMNNRRLGGSAYNSQSASFDYGGHSAHSTLPAAEQATFNPAFPPNTAAVPEPPPAGYSSQAGALDHPLGPASFTSQGTSVDLYHEHSPPSIGRTSYQGDSGRSTPGALPPPPSPWMRRSSDHDNLNVSDAQAAAAMASQQLPAWAQQRMVPASSSSPPSPSQHLHIEPPAFPPQGQPSDGTTHTAGLPPWLPPVSSPLSTSRLLSKQTSSNSGRERAPPLPYTAFAPSIVLSTSGNSLANTALSSPAQTSPAAAHLTAIHLAGAFSGNPFRETHEDLSHLTPEASALPSRATSPPPVVGGLSNPTYDTSFSSGNHTVSPRLANQSFMNALFEEALSAAAWTGAGSAGATIFESGMEGPGGHAAGDSGADSPSCKAAHHFGGQVESAVVLAPLH